MAVRRALVVLTVLVGLLAWPTDALADKAGVRALLDPSSPALAPFPSNLFTVADPDQLSGVRVSLPLPDCAALPSDCADVTVLNTLDGFSLQPRLSIPFSGPIDVASVSSSDFFLVDASGGAGKLIGTNQVVWEPATNTLHAESDQTLDQDRTYLLVATTAIRDAAGKPVQPSSFLQDLNFGAMDDRLKAYRKALIGALEAAGIDDEQVAAASLFTTQSATAILEKIRDQLHAATPAPAAFRLGLGGERTVFPLTGVSAVAFRQQVGTDPTLPSSFSTSSLPTPLLGTGLVGAIAFGRFSSPDYQTVAGVIPAVPTRTGTPAPQSTSDVYFNLFLPSGAQPPGGWPVAIFGHGVGNSKNVSPFAVAASLATRGIATIAINAVGHGGGPLGTLTVVRTDNTTVTLPAGGRGVDQNHDGVIGSFEGLTASPPSSLVLARDGVRQTVADEMQLVRELGVGMDVDGDGVPDLNGSRVFYLGQSFGGMHGTTFLAVEPAVRLGVLNVAGAPIVDVVRLSVPLRGLVSRFLGSRTPSLLNGGPAGFNENLPLRNQPPLVDTVAGADAIQEVLDRAIWIDEGGDPIGYASHVRKAPLAGVPAKSVIVQFAKGDQTVPNPATSTLIRAGDLTDRTTYFRNDLAYASDPAFPKDPHTFLTRISFPPPVGTVALEAQAQVATFFASDGQTLLDPDGPGPLFETPIAGPLPEELNFLP